MSKKKHDPVKALKAAFKEEIEDTELQDNYDGFKSIVERYREEYNHLATEINSNLKAIENLKEVVLKSAMCGILSPAAVEQIEELESDNETLIKEIEKVKNELEYNKKLIKRYEFNSNHKLFVWWQALKAVDPETEAWLEWKVNYENKII